MDFRLELVNVPVSDVDRAKAFHEQAGFGNQWAVQQIQPRGS